MKSILIPAAAAALLAPAFTFADPGEEIYNNRCSLCHAGGAGGAPRFQNREEWEPRAARGKLALYDTALHGKPNTAMRPRGGFRDLSNDEVMAAVDYMVGQAGLNPGLNPEAKPEPLTAPQLASIAPAAAVAAPAAGEPIDDRNITTTIAEAIRAQLAPSDNVEIRDATARVGSLGITVTTRDGVVTLAGTVKSAEIVERAESIARSVGGVKQVESELSSASRVE
ncbi:MAG TPA: c-type cytochrome [Burkholderiales bacterium]|nr:c-type cytochrome [Burkholderiales bacterium]